MAARALNPVSPYTILSVASGVLAARYGLSPVTTIAIGVGSEYLRDPGDEKGRSQALFDLTAYLVGYGVGLSFVPASTPKVQVI